MNPLLQNIPSPYDLCSQCSSKAILRRDYAMSRFPAAHPRISVASLRRWIEGDAHLLNTLKQCGYRPRSRWLNHRVLAILQSYL